MTNELRNEAAEARAYCETVWEWVQIMQAEPYMGFRQGQWCWRLPCMMGSFTGAQTEDEACLAAEQFTRAKQEEARQIEVELRYECSRSSMVSFQVFSWILHGSAISEWGMVALQVRGLCGIRRTITRLESALASARRGMKENQ